jgi:hypothetical protein
MPKMWKFYQALNQSKALIQCHGPYTVSDKKVFSRALKPADTTKVSEESITQSLIAARDSTRSAQQGGDAGSDLAVFESLWCTTVVALNVLIKTGELGHVNFGWGILGLCNGYVGHTSEDKDAHFLSLKTRLRTALNYLDSTKNGTEVDKSTEVDLGTEGYQGFEVRDVIEAARESIEAARVAIEADLKAHMLKKMNREVHICATLLLQLFRQERWSRIEWYHGIAIAKQWAKRLGMEIEDQAIS